MTFNEFKTAYPQFENFAIDVHLHCVSCTTKKPVWIRPKVAWPAKGTIIKGIFVSGFIRYMLAEQGHMLSNLGAYIPSLSSGLIAWMPAGGCLDNFVKVRLNTPQNQDQNRRMPFQETALHFPENPEVIFQYRFDMTSFSDIRAKLEFERTQQPGPITDPDADLDLDN